MAKNMKGPSEQPTTTRTPLQNLERFEEAKALLRKTMPVARRVLGESHELTLRMRWIYAKALYLDPGATLDDLREAVTTLEETDGPRGACWAARTRSRWILGSPARRHEKSAECPRRELHQRGHGRDDAEDAQRPIYPG